MQSIIMIESMVSAATLLLFVAFNDSGVLSFAPATVNSHRPTFGSGSNAAYRRADDGSTKSPTALAALTPIGPFCPFRSTASSQVDRHVQRLHANQPTFLTDMQKIQLDMHCGTTPDPKLLMRVANDMDATVHDWEELLKLLHSCGDFQTSEYAKLMDGAMTRHGLSTKSVATMLKWQSGCMKAMAMNHPPPKPPGDLDLDAMRKGDSNSSPSMSSMMRAFQITSLPFNPTMFESEPSIENEYEQLCNDHIELVEIGGSYSKFDPKGKIDYIYKLAAIHDRWDGFFQRNGSTGKLDPAFEAECQNFLDSMGLTEADFRSLLMQTHQRMVQEAKRELENSRVPAY